jgi:hypothetical protein
MTVSSWSEGELEQRLVSARPEPPTGFVRDLEASLFAPAERQRSRRPAWRPLFAAGAVTAALGAVALVLSLTGLSPLQGGGNDPASARGCVTVSEPQWVMQPTLILDKNGGFRMDERRTRIYRQVTRCP